MDYKKLDDVFEYWYLNYRKIADSADLQYFHFEKDVTATEDEILLVEEKIGERLPLSMRNFFLNYSKKISFKAVLAKEIYKSFPQELSGIFGPELFVSLDQVAEQEENRQGWIEACFTNKEDEYDKVWYNKLGFMHVPNGDVIAFDLDDGKEDHRVVYLSHDDGEGHGYVLGNTFIDFIENYAEIGCCGPEDWQMLPFIKDSESGIDGNCENLKMYKKLIEEKQNQLF